MTRRRAIAITARREIRERLRSREFRWSTAITVLIVVGIVVAIGFVAEDGPDRFDVAAVGAESEAIVETAQTEGARRAIHLNRRAVADEAAAVADGEVDAAVVEGRLLTTPRSPAVLVELLQDAARALRGEEHLREQGVPERDIEQALRPPTLEAVRVGEGEAGGEGLAILASLLLFVAILAFGTYLTTGVVEEKSSRVVELIVSTIRPMALLTGKVIGIGALGVAQILVVAGGGVLAALATGRLDLPTGTGSTIAITALYFALGYLLYAWGFAVAGAIVSRAEDVQTTTGPLTLILVIGYVTSVNLLDAPESTAAQVLTFVPLTAPLIAPVRAAQGALPAWELVVSLALALAAIAVTAWVATRIYERVALHMGAPVKLRQALRLAR